MECAEIIELDDIPTNNHQRSNRGNKIINLNQQWESIQDELPRCHPIITFVRSICGIVSSKNPARDNMSNERTLLAYIRTCLNVFLLGVIITQFTKHTILKPVNVSLGDDLNVYDPHNEAIIFLKNIVGLMNNFMKPLGGTVMSLSVIIGLIGVFRYWKIQSLLVNGPDMFEEFWMLMLLIIIVLVATVAASFVLIYKI